jgi:hypothetical protein
MIHQDRLITVNTIKVPEGIDWAALIKNAMDEYNVEIAGEPSSRIEPSKWTLKGSRLEPALEVVILCLNENYFRRCNGKGMDITFSYFFCRRFGPLCWQSLGKPLNT